MSQSMFRVGDLVCTTSEITPKSLAFEVGEVIEVGQISKKFFRIQVRGGGIILAMPHEIEPITVNVESDV